MIKMNPKNTKMRRGPCPKGKGPSRPTNQALTPLTYLKQEVGNLPFKVKFQVKSRLDEKIIFSDTVNSISLKCGQMIEETLMNKSYRGICCFSNGFRMTSPQSW